MYTSMTMETCFIDAYTALRCSCLGPRREAEISMVVDLKNQQFKEHSELWFIGPLRMEPTPDMYYSQGEFFELCFFTL